MHAIVLAIGSPSGWRSGKDILPWVRPDGKSQVTVEYRNGKPVRIDTIVVSTQHSPDVTNKQIERDIMEKVIRPMMPKALYDPASVKHHINPTGRFVVGGPMGDTGLTGRKIIVDTYGGHGSHGGGCFSGKDPTSRPARPPHCPLHRRTSCAGWHRSAKCSSLAIGCRSVSVW